jgi:hypothetical protein
MRTLTAILALLAVVTASCFLLGGGKTSASTPMVVVDVGSQEVRKAPSASPRTAGEHKLSMKRSKPDPAVIIGLLMTLGAQHRR